MNTFIAESDVSSKPLARVANQRPWWATLFFPVLAALASAALLTLAAPPFDLWPLAFIFLIPFYLVVKDLSPKRAAALGWLLGVATNLAAIGWSVSLLSRFTTFPAALNVLLVSTLVAYQALVFLVWAGGSQWLVRRFHLSWLLAAPLVMVLAETLFPFIHKWYLGIVLWRAWPLLQVAELGGPPAVSALVVLGNVILAETLLALSRRRWPTPATRWAALIFVFILVAGYFRVVQVDAARAQAPTLRLGLVQPNFGIQSVESREREGEGYYLPVLRQTTLDLVQRGAELVVWPETAFPGLIVRDLKREYPAGHPWELRPGLPDGQKGRLLLGTLTHAFGMTSEVYNSAMLISATGEVTGRYDKVELAFLGEYIPLASVFPEQVRKLKETHLPEWPETAAGAAPMLLQDGDLRVGVLICNEEILMSYAHQVARLGPNLLVGLSNDAWFGTSGASWQHLALGVFRAVETRRDLARAANTGVSAVVDAVGRVQLESPLYDVPRGQPLPPEGFVSEMALLDIFALGPYTAQYFPWACLAALGVGSVFARPARSGKKQD